MGHFLAFVAYKDSCGDCGPAAAKARQDGHGLCASYDKCVAIGDVAGLAACLVVQLGACAEIIGECQQHCCHAQAYAYNGEVAVEEAFHPFLEENPYNGHRDARHEYLQYGLGVGVVAECEE